VIYRRIASIAELWENPMMTSKNIFRSGQLYELYKLYKRDREIGREQLIEICEKYGLPKVKNGKYEFYNWSPLTEFLNMENLMKLYPDIKE
jgi:hypothetical protein